MARSLIFLLCLFYTVPALADNVRDVQRELSERGYAVGKVDGKFGRQTEGAIKNYQNDWQLPVTGKITDGLIARLKHQHPATKARMQKVDSSDCEVWNSYPQPRELITFKACQTNGPANGSGEVVWRWFAGGDWQTAVYEGEYKAGKMNGLGVLSYPNGDRYEGGFVDDQPQGKGKHEWTRGDSYEGEWKSGKPDGEGVYINNGVRITGTWRQGCHSKGKRRIWLFTSKKACGFK
jgi:hypothetical protein